MSVTLLTLQRTFILNKRVDFKVESLKFMKKIVFNMRVVLDSMRFIYSE